LVQEHAVAQSTVAGAESPSHDIEHAPEPQTTPMPVHTPLVGPHSTLQGPSVHFIWTSPHASTPPSQESEQAYLAGHAIVAASHASAPVQMTTHA